MFIKMPSTKPGSPHCDGNAGNSEMAMMTMLTVHSIKVLLDILFHAFVMRNHFNLEGGILSRLKI